MNAIDAERVLADESLVVCGEGSLADAKHLVSLCLAQDIPALLTSEACAKPGCTPKAQVLVREADAARVGQLLQTRWVESMEREGLTPIRAAAPDGAEGEPPCPACGTAAPLRDGACSDCGLQLE